jgi:hypothetical protein
LDAFDAVLSVMFTPTIECRLDFYCIYLNVEILIIMAFDVHSLNFHPYKREFVMKINICISLVFVSLISGCAVNFEPYQTPISLNSGNFTCKLGSPSTQQGMALCRSLDRVDQRRVELIEKIQKRHNSSFDLLQLGLGVVGAAAIASESHISVLEGLGIATAGVLGFKSYSNAKERMPAYVSGVEALTCINSSTGHLLWDDKWFYKLRYYRFALIDSSALAASYAANVSADDEPELLKMYAELSKLTSDAIGKADRASANYAALSGVVDTVLIKVVSEIRNREMAARGDVSGIVDNILAAKAIQENQKKVIESEAQALKEGAQENTPSDASVVKAEAALTTQAEVVATASVVVTATDAGAVATDQTAQKNNFSLDVDSSNC